MSVNKVILVGRLGRDPEVRYMPSGDAVANFSIATDEQWKDKNGERQTRTEWHNITLFGKLGEIAGQYLKKGGLVYIEGRIQSRKYTDKNGVERTAYDIIGNEMKMLGGKSDNQGSSRYDDATRYDDSHSATPAPAATPAPVRRQELPPVQPVEDLEDDIPF